MTSTHKFIEIVHQCGKQKYPIKKVYRRMLDVDLFLHAYGKLYANAGSMTKGIGDEGIDGMSLKRIEALIASLREGTFKWKPSRRVYIPKGGGKARPLGIPSWNDKLVQEVIRLILEAYYEPQFSPTSHGFRPQRSCHTALEEVKKWHGTRWWIEGDIKGCFENINHEVLINILKGSFKDTKFIKLIWQLLKSGYMEDWRYHKTYSGTPQGGIVSPILANIVLNELDKGIESLLQKWNKGRVAKHNPEWRKIRGQILVHKRKGNKPKVKQLHIASRKLPSTDQFDPTFRRLKYVRYADDFLLGFIGSKEEAQEIKQAITEMLANLKLSLNQEKTLITHAKSDRANFLGYQIKVSWDNSKLATVTVNGRKYKRRSINGDVQLLVPREAIDNWLSRYLIGGKPLARHKYIRYSDYDICSHYGGEWRGLVNYYALAMNLNALGQVYWRMNQSFQNTLASKHKCPTRTIRTKYQTKINGVRGWVVKVQKRQKPGEYLTATFGGIPLKVNSLKPNTDKVYIPYLVTTELIQRLQADQCELCGSTTDIEVHHIRALKDAKGKADWQIRMQAMRRKTLMVCKVCHQSIHKN